jgi:hypothetical protein
MCRDSWSLCAKLWFTASWPVRGYSTKPLNFHHRLLTNSLVCVVRTLLAFFNPLIEVEDERAIPMMEMCLSVSKLW